MRESLVANSSWRTRSNFSMYDRHLNITFSTCSKSFRVPLRTFDSSTLPVFFATTPRGIPASEADDEDEGGREEGIPPPPFPIGRGLAMVGAALGVRQSIRQRSKEDEPTGGCPKAEKPNKQTNCREKGRGDNRDKNIS